MAAFISFSPILMRSIELVIHARPEQDLEGLLESPGPVTTGDEGGMDDPSRGSGLTGLPARRCDLPRRPRCPVYSASGQDRFERWRMKRRVEDLNGITMVVRNVSIAFGRCTSCARWSRRSSPPWPRCARN